jgi:MYST family zinc finger domain
MPVSTLPLSPILPSNLSPIPKPRARRTSLSQAERNVREVILSDLRIDAWFPSFYPEELIGKTISRLFVCKWCFKYTTKLIPFVEHTNVR